ncbi:DUF3618 domain-containing protein [Streptomyces enissocaesilis]|uniref:DUF3618 domain-containing protein n=1 Tax=Streptomyces enissocaesilis TaxID=332589 RepID=A0ABP6JQ49_9ACTN
MTVDPQDNGSTPTPEELREQVEGTREKLGQTVEALAAKADVKTQAQQKAVQTKERIAQAAAAVADKFQEKTPDPVLEKAYQAPESARSNRGLLIAGVAALVVLVLVRRKRKGR